MSSSTPCSPPDPEVCPCSVCSSCPIRLALKVLRLSLRITGFGNASCWPSASVIGLLIAPTSGAEFRQRLQARLDERRRRAGPAGTVRQSRPAVIARC